MGLSVGSHSGEPVETPRGSIPVLGGHGLVFPRLQDYSEPPQVPQSNGICPERCHPCWVTVSQALCLQTWCLRRKTPAFLELVTFLFSTFAHIDTITALVYSN